jgi:hypothetical protein
MSAVRLISSVTDCESSLPKTHLPHSRFVVNLLFLLAITAPFTACSGLFQDRVIYSERGTHIGIEHDPSTDRGDPPVANNHPAKLTIAEVRNLLGGIQISGWSGAVMGFLASPRAVPLFNREELAIVAEPLTVALTQAGSRERVFFSLPNPKAAYGDDRTVGSLFLRGPYLHVIVTDHSAFIRADTAGGDDLKDPRDTKGMKLSVALPAHAAMPLPEELPRWGPYEKVHISLNVRDTLTAVAESPRVGPLAEPNPASAPSDRAPPTKSSGAITTAPGTGADLQQQIQNVTSSNRELREQLKQQSDQMQELKEELERLKQDMSPPQSKQKSGQKPQR